MNLPPHNEKKNSLPISPGARERFRRKGGGTFLFFVRFGGVKKRGKGERFAVLPWLCLLRRKKIKEREESRPAPIPLSGKESRKKKKIVLLHDPEKKNPGGKRKGCSVGL